MQTLSLHEAAAFLKMTPEGLRRKVVVGEVPGAKPGKCWVFREDDLAEYLRSLYPKAAKTLQGVIESDRRKIWHSTKEIIYGGLKLATLEEKYNEVLGLKTS